MQKRLAYTNLLGVDASLKNGTLKEGSINAEILETKRKFPREVVLCRIGEFYEAVGFDACMLVEHAGLNPMGGARADNIPKAGCPVLNLRQTLDSLTSVGLSVCIMEEASGPTVARQRKNRFISGHAHPGSPYVYGLAAADIDVHFPEPLPVVGLARSSRGYIVVSITELLRTYSMEEGLTEEGVIAKLRSKGYQRLFLHSTMGNTLDGTAKWTESGEGGLLWAECHGKPYDWYQGDPLLQLQDEVCRMFDLPLQEPFRLIAPPAGDRIRPLYVSTASQIGILTTPGVPSLIRSLLPADLDSRGLCEAYLRDLLLNPPPQPIALSIQAASKLMCQLLTPVPSFTCVSSAKMVKLIRDREANHVELARVRQLAEDFLSMHASADLRPIAELLLDPTWLAAGIHFNDEQLLEDCQHIVAKVNDVLAVPEDPEQAVSMSEHIPDDFFMDHERSWKGKVMRKHAAEAFANVDEAAAALHNTVTADFLPVIERLRSLVGPALVTIAGRAEVCYHREQGFVLLKAKGLRRLLGVSTDHLSASRETFAQLIHPVDNKGKRMGDDWHTTPTIDGAVRRYHAAVEAAGEAVVGTLRHLTGDLQEKLNSIIALTAFSTICKTLFEHVRESRRKGWTYPTFVDKPSSKQKSPAAEDREVRFEGLVPFWLEPISGRQVANDIAMSSIFLLTGPNGGGKSSLLRSTCAAALLASCGLAVPAKSGSVPPLDLVIIRMMSADSPADGKSSFQVEMAELRTIEVEATERSLVFVDELCKGTEVTKGTAIAAAVLEALAARRCLGIFSTHLHGLLDHWAIGTVPSGWNNGGQQVVRKAMGTAVQDDGRRVPTWVLSDGECRESLAFEVARQEGVSSELVTRAKEIYHEMTHDKPRNTNHLSQLEENASVQAAPAALVKNDAIGKVTQRKVVKDSAKGRARGRRAAAVLLEEDIVLTAYPDPESAAEHIKGQVEVNLAVNSHGGGEVVDTQVQQVEAECTLLSQTDKEGGGCNGSYLSSLDTLIGSNGSLMHFEVEPSSTCSTYNTRPAEAATVTEAIQKSNSAESTVACNTRSKGTSMQYPSSQQVAVSFNLAELSGLLLASFGNQALEWQIVMPRQVPPPGAVSQSCVYVIHRPDNRFYVGQTDNIWGRIRAHRAKGLRGATIAYVRMPDMSAARSLETVLIGLLQARGVLLTNTGDASHRHFGLRNVLITEPPF
eukprot:SM000039S14443  [mRNA]  locus=s39:108821:115808:- [translate_table: standard]